VCPFGPDLARWSRPRPADDRGSIVAPRSSRLCGSYAVVDTLSRVAVNRPQRDLLFGQELVMGGDMTGRRLGSAPEPESLQLRRLQGQLWHACDNVPRCRWTFDEAGLPRVHPCRLGSNTPFARLITGMIAERADGGALEPIPRGAVQVGGKGAVLDGREPGNGVQVEVSLTVYGAGEPATRPPGAGPVARACVRCRYGRCDWRPRPVRCNWRPDSHRGSGRGPGCASGGDERTRPPRRSAYDRGSGADPTTPTTAKVLMASLLALAAYRKRWSATDATALAVQVRCQRPSPRVEMAPTRV